jgi:L-serine deaminase
MSVVVTHGSAPVAGVFCLCPADAAALRRLQLKMSDQDLIYLASAGRQLVAKPYSKRMSHKQGLEGCVAAAEVSISTASAALAVWFCSDARWVVVSSRGWRDAWQQQRSAR